MGDETVCDNGLPGAVRATVICLEETDGVKAGLARQLSYLASSVSRVPGDEQRTRAANIESEARKRKHSVVRYLE